MHGLAAYSEEEGEEEYKNLVSPDSRAHATFATIPRGEGRIQTRPECRQPRWW